MGSKYSEKENREYDKFQKELNDKLDKKVYTSLFDLLVKKNDYGLDIKKIKLINKVIKNNYDRLKKYKRLTSEKRLLKELKESGKKKIYVHYIDIKTTNVSTGGKWTIISVKGENIELIRNNTKIKLKKKDNIFFYSFYDPKELVKMRNKKWSKVMKSINKKYFEIYKERQKNTRNSGRTK